MCSPNFDGFLDYETRACSFMATDWSYGQYLGTLLCYFGNKIGKRVLHMLSKPFFYISVRIFVRTYWDQPLLKKNNCRLILLKFGEHTWNLNRKTFCLCVFPIRALFFEKIHNFSIFSYILHETQVNRSHEPFLLKKKQRDFWSRWTIPNNLMKPAFLIWVSFSICLFLSVLKYTWK